MGGEIGVDTVEGEGSCFYFTCVLEKAKEDFEMKEPLNMKQDENHYKINILLVEDDLVSRTIIEKYAELKGWYIISSNDGNDAIDIFKQNKFDIVLMDVQMPIMNGYIATGNIRSYERKIEIHTPIIALTAFSINDDREKCFEVGMDDYLSKPVDLNELNNMVIKWTQKQ